ncbi:MAG: hypothetical protein IPK07_00045 [Deltaproteobacteria bacterium]|nr:hypothetical protein [Deltaproteobacteria bacterium]
MTRSTHGLQQRLLGLGTDKLQELMGEMMKNEHFQQALGQAMTRALSAKHQLDKNMQMVLGLLSVPSRGDVRRIEDRIEGLASQIAALTGRLDAIAGQAGAKGTSHAAPRPAKRAAKRKTR